MAAFDDILAKIATALKGITKANGYETDLLAPIEYGADLTKSNRVPVLGMVPSGDITIEVEEAATIRFSQGVEIVGYVTDSKQSNARTQLYNLSDDVKTCLMASPDLGTYGLGIIYVSEDPILLQGRAFFHQIWRVVYYDTSIKSDSAAGTDVYGSADVFSDAIDKVYTLMDALKTAMSASDPTFSYVYKGHHKAALQLNAVTVDCVGSGSDHVAGNAMQVIDHTILISVRVHTAYAGGIIDGLQNARLLNSIQSYLFANVWLGDNYIIEQIYDAERAVDFDESKTRGGEIHVTIKAMKEYAQL